MARPPRISSLRDSDELVRISHPVDCYLEAGCIADKLVKKGGPAIIFDQPRLANGEISKFPLAMNLFGKPEKGRIKHSELKIQKK